MCSEKKKMLSLVYLHLHAWSCSFKLLQLTPCCRQMNKNYQRHLHRVTARPLLQIKLEFGDAGFCGGRKTGEPGEKPSERGENQQQTQITCPPPSRNRTRVTWVGRERSHHCAIPPLLHLLSYHGLMTSPQLA